MSLFVRTSRRRAVGRRSVRLSALRCGMRICDRNPGRTGRRHSGNRASSGFRRRRWKRHRQHENRPLQGVEIAVQQATSDHCEHDHGPFGRYIITTSRWHLHSQSPTSLGTGPKAHISRSQTSGTRNFKLFPTTASLEAVEITAQAPVAISTTTGDQTYSENEAIAAPSTTTSGRHPTIDRRRCPRADGRGPYPRSARRVYVLHSDGVPVPPGISGSLNELFSPQVAQSIDFQTGGWDAEYGGRQSAIINIETGSHLAPSMGRCHSPTAPTTPMHSRSR